MPPMTISDRACVVLGIMMVYMLSMNRVMDEENQMQEGFKIGKEGGGKRMMTM